MQAELQDAIVSSLLDPTTRLWNLTLLPIVFTLVKAKLIQNIPLSQVHSDAALFWPFVQYGQYTTKSRYYFLKKPKLETLLLQTITTPRC